jgi:PRTRC genetic system protein C
VHEGRIHPDKKRWDVCATRAFLSVEEIRTLYSQQCPEIATATVTGPEQVGDKLVYRFSRSTKG